MTTNDSGSLFGNATDDGLPSGTLTYSWTLVNGNASGVEMTSATGTVVDDRATALVTFSELGGYAFRLTVDDGELQGFDEVTITVIPPPSIALMSPVGGERLVAGQIFHIQWSTVDVDVVDIWFSPDNGLTWEPVEFGLIIDFDPDWGDYSWTVPDTPSTQCLIHLCDWFGSVHAVSAPFEIRGDTDGDGMPDVWETTHGLDPDSADDAGADGDGDKLTNLREFLHSTDPNEWDTDGDGASDGAEVSAGYNPNDPLDTPPPVSGDGCTVGVPAGACQSLALLAVLGCLAMLRRPNSGDSH